MWPPRAKVKAKLATGVCFYNAFIASKCCLWKPASGWRRRKLNAREAVHYHTQAHVHKHAPVCVQTNGKAMSCMTAQTVQSLTNAQDAASIFCSIIPSVPLSFFYHTVYPPTRTHTYTPTHTNTLTVPPVSCLYFSLCPRIFISLNLFFTLLLGVCAAICHHCSV